MAYRRMINKSISASRKLERVSDFAALLFTWMIPHADDGGNLEGDAMSIRAVVTPRRDKTIVEIDKALTELTETGLVTMYKPNGEVYLHINQFERFQTLRSDRIDVRFPPFSHTNGKPAVNQRVSITKHNLTEHNLTEHTLSRRGKRGDDSVRDTLSFDRFWKYYPRKTHRTDALLAWGDNEEELVKKLEQIIAFIEVAKESEQWQEKRYIPTAGKFLRNRRWEDDPKAYESAQPPSLNLNEV